MTEDHNALGPLAQLRTSRCAQELGVTHKGLGAAARPGGGLGQKRPVQVLGERAAQTAEVVRGVADNDQPAHAISGASRLRRRTVRRRDGGGRSG